MLVFLPRSELCPSTTAGRLQASCGISTWSTGRAKSNAQVLQGKVGDDCCTISVTGHSLGGGIATIVGATLNISAINVVAGYVLLFCWKALYDSHSSVQCLVSFLFEFIGSCLSCSRYPLPGREYITQDGNLGVRSTAKLCIPHWRPRPSSPQFSVPQMTSFRELINIWALFNKLNAQRRIPVIVITWVPFCATSSCAAVLLLLTQQYCCVEY